MTHDSMTTAEVRELLADQARAAALRARGRHRQQAGDRFEKAIEAAGRFYRQHTWAPDGRYRRRLDGDPPVAMLTRNRPRTAGRPGHMKVVEKADVDFAGQVRFPGDAIAWPVSFDCKGMTGKVSFQVPDEDWHQLTYLADVRAGGGLACYLLHDAREERVWVLDDLATLLTGRSVSFRRMSSQVDRARPKGPKVWLRTACDLVPHTTWGLFPGVAWQGYDVLPLLAGLRLGVR